MAKASNASIVPSAVVRIVFIALVCDLMAFTMPLPLFPRLIKDFMDKEAAQHLTSPTLLSHVLTQVRHLRQLLFSYSRLPAPPASQSARWDLTLLGGLLGSLFSFCQFIVSPHLGALSDKHGRRPVLLLSMLGNVASALLWLFAADFSTYALSRVVGGLSEGNVQLSIAVISDVTDDKARSRALALVGAAFSVAFTVGPSLGAYFASRTIGRGEKVTLWNGKEVKLNGYAVPALVTVVLLVVETAYLFVKLPETRWYTAPSTATSDGDKNGHDVTKVPVGRTLEERKARLKKLEWLHLWFLFFFSGAEFTLTFLTYNLFAYTNAQNGKLLGFIGVLSSLLQGGYTRRTRVSPAQLAFRGIVASFISLVTLASLPFVTPATAIKLLYVAGAGLAFVSATVVTSLTALASLECSPSSPSSPSPTSVASKESANAAAASSQEIDKGSALGAFRSRGQLGRSLGPLVATGAYFLYGPTWAYGIAAAGSLAVAVGTRGALLARPTKLRKGGKDL